MPLMAALVRRRLLPWFLLLALGFQSRCLAEVLIVADEFPAMQVVASRLRSDAHIESTAVAQDKLPDSLTRYEAVVVYIHGALAEKAEDTFIQYTEAGGKLLLLHHSISSGKRKNAHWFDFLGVSLPSGDLTNGGYKWMEGISFELVNLSPAHFIMTNHVVYPDQIAYVSTNISRLPPKLPGFKLVDTEVYLNHVHRGPRTLLMGLKFTDKTGITYEQDRAGWLKPAKKGWVVYLMPGHRKEDFENPTYSQIVLNAILWSAPPNK